MLNKIIFTLLLLLSTLTLYSQVTNISKGAAIIYTNGQPSGTPRTQYDSEWAIDITTSKIWRFNRTNSVWVLAGSMIGKLNSNAAPTVAPKYGEPDFVINNSNLIYWYNSSVWNCLNCASVPYTAGTGISIGSNVITNTAPDQTVVLTGAGISAISGTYPNFTITSTEVDGSTTNEIQQIDSFTLSNDTLFLSLSSDGVPQKFVVLTGLSASSGGGIYGVSDTVTYHHQAVIDSGITFLSDKDSAYFDILYDLTVYGAQARFTPDSLTLKQNDIGGTNRLDISGNGINLFTTSPDRVTIRGNDARYYSDHRATFDSLSITHKDYNDDTYLQYVDTFRVSNDTLYISLFNDSISQSFVTLPLGSSPQVYNLDIVTPIPAVDVEGSIILKTVDVNGSKYFYASDGSNWIPGGLFLDTLNVLTIHLGNNQVTYAKMQQATAQTLLGNPTGSTANVGEITLGTGLTFSGTTLVNSAPDQTVSLTGGGITTIGGTYPNFTITSTEVDGSVSNEIQTIDTFTYSGGIVTLSLLNDGQPAKTIDISSLNTDNQTLDTFEIVSNILRASLSGDNQPFKSVDLSSYVNVATDLSISGASSPFTINSSTGTDITLTEGTGITLSGNSSNVTITNSSPDQTVVLNNGTGISISGTYPNFTITNTSTNTDAQTLSWNGSNGELSISGGNTVDLDGRYLQSEVDGSTTNEIQRLDTFEIVSNTLRASLLNDGVPFSTVDLSPYLDNTDTSGYNLSFTRSNDTLFITDGDGTLFVKLPADINTDEQELTIDSVDLTTKERFLVTIDNGNTIAFDVDYNTDSQTLSIGGSGPYTLDISGGTGITLSNSGIVTLSESPSNTLVIGATEVDGSVTNEIQTIDTFTIVSNVLRLSLSNDNVPFSSVNLSSYLDNTDSQTLSVDSTDIGGTIERFEVSISNGNSIYIDVPQVAGLGGGQNNVGANLGAGTGIYAGKTDTTLNFKSLVEGYGIDYSNTSTEITIKVDTAQIATLHDVAVVQDDINAHELADGDLDDTNELQTLSIDSSATVDGQNFTISLSDDGDVSFFIPDVSVGVNIYNSDGNILAGEERNVNMDTLANLLFMYPNGSTAFRIYGGDDSTGVEGRVEMTSHNGNAYVGVVNDIAYVGGTNLEITADGNQLNTDQILIGDGSGYAVIGETPYNTNFYISGDSLYLTDGKGTLFVELSSYLDNTDSQNLGYTAATGALTISGGTGTTIPVMTASVRGLVPDGDGSGTDEFLREDGTWAIPPSASTDLIIGGSGPTYTIESSTGTDVTISGAGIITLSESPSNTLVITGTEVDGSTTNEIQDITVTGASQPFTLDLGSDATDATFTGAGITTLTRSGNDITITSTEVDGSTTNELQTITNSSDATSHTVTLSNSGGTVQFIEGAGITLTTGGSGSAGTVTIASTITDTDTQDLSIDSTTIGGIERFTISLTNSPSVSFDVSNTVGTVTSVGITQPAAGITVSGSPITSSGNMTLALANDLAGVEGLSTTGLAVRTGDGTWTTRSISTSSLSSSYIGIGSANTDGVSGNPTFVFNNHTATSKLFVQAVATTNLDLNGTETIDGVSISAGQRVLVAGQTNQEDNGIWDCAAGAWTRSTDADAASKLDPGVLVAVKLGTTYGATYWKLDTKGPFTLGTTDLVFSQVFKDESITNEIQQIDTFSITTSIISASLSSDGVPAKTIDITESVQDITGAMVSGNTETGITVTYDDSDGTLDFVATDASATNEIQTIDTFEIVSNTLRLSLLNDGLPFSSVNLSSYLDNTDDQTLSVDSAIIGDIERFEISIENGNSVFFDVNTVGKNIYNSNGNILADTVRNVNMDSTSTLRFNYPTGEIALILYAGDNSLSTGAEFNLNSPDQNKSLSITDSGVQISSSSAGNHYVRITDDGIELNVNSNLGSSGQILYSDGQNVYWDDAPTGGVTDLTFTGASSPYTLNSSTGTDVTFTNGSGITITRSSNDLSFAATDASVTNEGSLTVGAGGGNSSTIVSNTSGSTAVTIDGSGIVTVTESGSTITIGATEVDGSTSNEIQDLSLTGTGPYVIDISSSSNDITVSAGTGISLSESPANTLVVTNSAPDQTVSLTNGGGISVSGTYPSFTLTATDQSTTNEAWTIDGDDADTEVISNQTVKFQGAGITTTDYNPTTDVLLITSTEVDGSVSNEGSLTVGAGGGNSSTIVSNTSGSTAVTLEGGANITITESGSTITIAASSGSGTDLTFTGESSPYTLNSSSGTDVTFASGTGISISRSSNELTIASTVTDTDDQNLSIGGSGPTYTLDITDGTGVTVSGAGIITLSESPANTLIITGTEVDGSVSNEGSLTVGAGTGTTSIINSNTSGSTGVTIEAGTGMSISESGSTITLAATNNGTVTSVAATAPAAGFTISGSPITTSGTFTFALADDLAALEGLASTGIAVRTASNTWAQRSISVSALSSSYIGVGTANTGGVSGNPTFTFNNHTATSKLFVQAVSTTNLDLNGTETIDGVSITAGQRVLVAGQTDNGDNGIYDCAAGAWTRSTDFDASSKWDAGALIHVKLGTTYGATYWKLDTKGSFTVGTTDITFSRVFQDESTTNELQTIANTSDATSHTVTLSNSGGSVQLVEGTGVTLTTTGTSGAGIVTIAATNSGTVTNFSAGDLSPLFTTTESNTTTTPALSFTLSNAGANTYFGNATGSTAAPSYTAAGSLTKVDDTNVTLTLGGNPTTSLLRDASLTLGWTGQLAVSRGGTGAGSLTGLLQGNGTSPVTAITNSSTVGQILRVTGASTYAWGALDLADGDAITGNLPVANLNSGTGASSSTFWRGDGTWATPAGVTDLTIGGTGPTYTIESSTGTDVTISGAGIITLSESPANTLIITGTEVDGSVSNEGSLTVGAGSGTTSTIVSNTSGSTAVTIEASTGLSISESGSTITLTNTGDTNASDDITGSGNSGRIAYFNGTQTVTSDADLTFNGDQMGIGTSPSTSQRLYIKQSTTNDGIFIERSSSSSGFRLYQDANSTFESSGNMLVKSMGGTIVFEPPGGSGFIQGVTLVPTAAKTDTFVGSAFFNIEGTYSPTLASTLTGYPSLIRLGTTINQTGGANQPTNGLYIDPVLTSAPNDFRGVHYKPSTHTFLWQPSGDTVRSFIRGKLGIGPDKSVVSYRLDVGGTDGIRVPVGTTAQRPTGAEGVIRFNTDADILEWHDGSDWQSALGGGGGPTSWSAITAPTGNLSLAHGSNTTAFTFNSVTSSSAFGMSSSSLSSGILLDLSVASTAAASNSQTVLNVATSGANATSSQSTFASSFLNTHTGTSSVNYAVYASASGASTNYAVYTNNGSVRIGDLTSSGNTLVGATSNGLLGEVTVGDGLSYDGSAISGMFITAAPSSNTTVSGEKIQFTANENQAFGDVVYIASDGDATLADADGIATAKVVAMCTATVTTGNTATYLLKGIARNDTWNWTVGGYVYLSTTGTTGNTLTQTAPSGTDDCVVIVGIATHADRILVNPSQTIVEVK